MSSSIFSSEYFQHYASLARSRKLWHLTVGAVLLLVTGICLQIPDRLYSSDRSLETMNAADVAALSTQTQVLCLGSSHVQWGIQPQDYTLHVSRLGSPVLDYACMECLVRKHLQHVPNLKVAVLELDDVPLLINTLENLRDDLRPLLALGLNPLEIPADSLAQRGYNLIYSVGYPIITLPRLTPRDWINWRDDERRNATQRAIRQRHTRVLSLAAIQRHELLEMLNLQAQDSKIMLRNWAALSRTIELLRSHNITVVLLRLPHHPTYWSHRPPFIQQRFSWLQGNLAIHYGHDNKVLIWDFGQVDNFSSNWFIDDNHLNDLGARHFATILDNQLHRLVTGSPAGEVISERIRQHI